jgi:hypothetical protein
MPTVLCVSYSWTSPVDKMLTEIGTQFSNKVPPVAMESVEAEQKLGNSLDLQPVVLLAPLLCISLLAHTLPPSGAQVHDVVHCTIPHRYLYSAIGSPVHHHSYKIRHKFLHLMICLCCCHWFTLHQLCHSSRIQSIYDLDSDSCTESGRLQTCKSSNIQKSKHDSKPPSMTQNHSHVDEYLVYKFFI